MTVVRLTVQAVMVAALLLTIGAGAAFAQSPLSQSLTSPACGVAELTATNDSKFPFVWSIHTSDGQTFNLTVAAGTTAVERVDLTEDSTDGAGWASAGNTAGPESDWYLPFTTASVKTDCEPPASEPPVSEPPVSEPPTSEPPTSEPPTSEPPTSEPPASEPADPDPSEVPTDDEDPITYHCPAGYIAVDLDDDGVITPADVCIHLDDGTDRKPTATADDVTGSGGNRFTGGTASGDFPTPTLANLGGGGAVEAGMTVPAKTAAAGGVLAVVAGAVWLWRRTRAE